MDRVLLDTDILSAIMRKDAAAIENAREYLGVFGRFTFSAITQYEILRGLKAKNAFVQTENFGAFCSRNEILPVTSEVSRVAADVYAGLATLGALIGDADILIAATALAHGMGVVTNNVDHFSRVSGLAVRNWLR